MAHPDISDVRRMCERHQNWGRWGADDQRGTLNHVSAESIAAAARLVRTGKVFSMALGVLRNGVTNAVGSMVGRGVLLDIPVSRGVQWLEPGAAIGGDDLQRAADAQDVTVRRGDFVFVRTGAMAQVREAGSWGDYVGGPAAGLGFGSVEWVAANEVAAVATDTWGMEVLPNETPDVYQPLHIIFIVHMGLWVGEIYDLEPLAAACRRDGSYEFLFCGPPLPFSRAVGSPVNPMAIK